MARRLRLAAALTAAVVLCDLPGAQAPLSPDRETQGAKEQHEPLEDGDNSKPEGGKREDLQRPGVLPLEPTPVSHSGAGGPSGAGAHDTFLSRLHRADAPVVKSPPQVQWEPTGSPGESDV